ncbi:Hsp70 family protein [Rivibacter subsaxonicus]|uniref:Putative chaperone protein n=1 Tax=Rivibacter subsaxonicus TaxID=457575 RepID=A0A4Q7W1L6_9BURK|nr:Hsp70 family protein [Rivibacter subsaxonicus]RZU02913.1 putative chaperone protein [Rivibacter subsaxonicus]
MSLSWCAIDFGTSNSAVAVPDAAARGGSRLVVLEDSQPTMPTAVFYFAEHPPLAPGAEPPRAVGRAAIAAYVDGYDGRLMRSMKSLLGSSLFEQSTDVGGGHALRYRDVVTGYLRHLKAAAEHAAGTSPAASVTRAVIGRPVFFVDDDPVRDATAQAALEACARDAGLRELAFQYEPIAAAFDHEAGCTHEELVLVADIGGGTSDFSIVRVGPQRRDRLERADDILGNHGVHVAGTDFDRRLELEALLPALGYRSHGPASGGRAAREVPSAVYHDLATWHLINTVYAPARVAELQRMASWYADPAHHRRLMQVLRERLGHELAARTEAAKIDVAQLHHGDAAKLDEQAEVRIALDAVEAGLSVRLGERQAMAALDAELERIVDAARQTVRDAGLAPARIDTLYFTGGSTGLAPLVARLAAAFPQARAVRGDRLSSVARGLGLHALRLFGPVASAR